MAEDGRVQMQVFVMLNAAMNDSHKAPAAAVGRDSSAKPDYSIYVPFFRRILAARNFYLDENSKILDFGCGAGGFVYAFRDAGFNARGFDIHDYLDLRSPSDRRYFDIAHNGAADNSIMTVDWETYRLPYEDRSFDFVLSFETMEHVLNLDAVMREISRITRPDGVGLHIFPPKYRFLEGHTYVPFGGMSRSFLYNLLWTSLGVRNEYQTGLSAMQRAKLNARYARSGTSYPPISKVRGIGRKYFEGAHFAPELWHTAWGHYGWRLTRPALLAYTLFNEIVWVLERPRQNASTVTELLP